MTDKQYLSENILQNILKKLDDLQQLSDNKIVVNYDTINCLLEQAQHSS